MLHGEIQVCAPISIRFSFPLISSQVHYLVVHYSLLFIEGLIGFRPAGPETAFSYRILNVVLRCALKQMLGVDADRDIALVTNVMVRCDCADKSEIREPRGSTDLTLPPKVGMAFASTEEPTISL